ncbi:ML domain-containing protein [Abortiporus biennis]|nr:ML domain-containing protein [Abortiporus biennis]
MARFAFLALMLASLSTFCAAAVVDQEVIAHVDAVDVEPLAPVSDRWKWEDCGDEDFLVHIKDISISPDPPKPGEPMTVTVLGEADDLVEDGAYAEVAVKVGVIKILQKEFDLCEEARTANTSIQCPVEKGIYEVIHTVDLPKEIPPAIFSVDVNGYTDEDDDLICLKLRIDFRPKRHLLW